MVRQIFWRLLSFEFPKTTIELAANGQEAVERFQSEHHAVVLMDLHMPVMDGERAYREIERFCEKENWAVPAMVFCTGYDASPDIRALVSTHPRHCMLQKPVKNQILVEMVRARLAHDPSRSS
jgi:CheY-like chemotaxis protein